MEVVSTPQGEATAISSPEVLTSNSPENNEGIQKKPGESESTEPTYKKSKHRVKLEGKEVDIDYDELVRGYSKNSVSEKRFQEASKLRDEYTKLMDQVKAGDLSVLSQIVPSDKLMEYAESLHSKRAEWESLSPAEQRALVAEYERDEALKEKKKYEDEKTHAREQKLSLEVADELDQEIASAVEEMRKRDPNLHVTYELLIEVARAMEAQRVKYKGDIKQVSAVRAAEIATKNMKSNLEAYLKSMPADKIRNLLPKDVLDAIRREDVEKTLSQLPSFGKRKTVEKKSEGVAKKGMGTDEWFTKIEKKFK